KRPSSRLACDMNLADFNARLELKLINEHEDVKDALPMEA
ncbi:hypothetical protein A2U01_0116538, partial [Trifolium medium]|nr:hypothetical protein [Trifolium medium]